MREKIHSSCFMLNYCKVNLWLIKGVCRLKYEIDIFNIFIFIVFPLCSSCSEFSSEKILTVIVTDLRLVRPQIGFR